MSAPIHLAVDTLSGDFGLRTTLPASLQALRENPALHLHLVGDADLLQQETSTDANGFRDRLTFIHAPDIIPMDAKPSSVLRAQDQSSLRGALTSLAEGEVAGVVSAGNTGALMALSRQMIHMLDGFSRPAFCSQVPTTGGTSYILDLGANVDCNAALLHEFALMGSLLVGALHEMSRPRVALVSNGSEAGKGSAQVRLAAELLEEDSRINYCGYIEGDGLHNSQAEVLVCDGFVGNIALKTMEGTARYGAEQLSLAYTGGIRGALLALLGLGKETFTRAIDPETHSGAFLLGLKGVVVKSHGASSSASFAIALEQAVACVEHDMISRMAESQQTSGRDAATQ